MLCLNLVYYHEFYEAFKHKGVVKQLLCFTVCFISFLLFFSYYFLVKCIHRSILLLIKLRVTVGLESNSAVKMWETAYIPSGHRSVTGNTERQTFIHTYSNIKSPLKLTCMSIDCGRKPEQPQRTHRDTRRTNSTQKDSSQLVDSNPAPS